MKYLKRKTFLLIVNFAAITSYANEKCLDLYQKINSTVETAATVTRGDRGEDAIRKDMAFFERIDPQSPAYDRDFTKSQRVYSYLDYVQRVEFHLKNGGNPYSLVRVSEPIVDVKEWASLIGNGTLEKRRILWYIEKYWEGNSETQKLNFWREYNSSLMPAEYRNYKKIAAEHPHLSFLLKPIGSGFRIPDSHVRYSEIPYASTTLVHKFKPLKDTQWGPFALKQKSIFFEIESPEDFVRNINSKHELPKRKVKVDFLKGIFDSLNQVMPAIDPNAKEKRELFELSVKWDLERLFPFGHFHLIDSSSIGIKGDSQASDSIQNKKNGSDFKGFWGIFNRDGDRSFEMVRSVSLEKHGNDTYNIVLAFSDKSSIKIRLVRNPETKSFVASQVEARENRFNVTRYDVIRNYYVLERQNAPDVNYVYSDGPYFHNYYFKNLEDIEAKFLDVY